ncbi:hypothetical protein [Micromonospora carbonacea]|uniref:hypothetical protein n=1 Tax=Micromonospora carbonacea TaxID=47853 RepID=UPI00371E127A
MASTSAPTRTQQRLLLVGAAFLAGLALALATSDDAHADTGSPATEAATGTPAASGMVERLLTPPRQRAHKPAETDQQAKPRPRPVRDLTRTTVGTVGQVVDTTTRTIRAVTDAVDTITAPLPVAAPIVDEVTDTTDRVLDAVDELPPNTDNTPSAPQVDPEPDVTTPPANGTTSQKGTETAPDLAANNPHVSARSGADHPNPQHPAAAHIPATAGTKPHHKANATLTAFPAAAATGTHAGQAVNTCTGGASGDNPTGSSHPYAITSTWRPHLTHPQTAHGRERPHHGRTCPADPPTG